MSADPLILAPYGVDPLPLLARRLLNRHADELPDLSHHIALFPHPGGAARFRAALLAAAHERGVEAVLPPWTGTVSAWLTTQASPKSLTPAARELVLLHALADFPALSDRFGPWSLIDGVLPLFDELTGNVAPLPTDSDGIRQMLKDGYGITKPSAPLEREADWISLLWRTWTEHLAAHGWQDAALAHRAALKRALDALPSTTHIYMAAEIGMPAAERQWLRELLQKNQLTLLLQGQCHATADYHPNRPLAAILKDLNLTPPPSATPDAYGHFLDQVYTAGAATLRDRARDIATRYPQSPALHRLAVYVASDLETEAHAVEVQIRRWLLAGLHNIAIVTPDRKLARRVRALLERADVALQDSAGWALSTTSAATALARWLECCEQQFAHGPLLDFLKSPFVSLGLSAESYAPAVRRLEHHLIRRHGLNGGLARYRSVWRHQRNTETDHGAVDQLLDVLASAAEPITRFVAGGRTHVPAAYLEALAESLKRLGLLSTLQTDPAGRELLAAIDQLRAASTAHGTRLTYASFRNWLERELERRRFRPIVPEARIHLLSASESSYGYFDAVVIAGCTAEHMPGTIAPSPFFNETVRRNLGLPAAGDRLSRGLYDFRRLLQAAPTVLVSYRRYEGREPKLPSPWLERLVAFHRAAYGPLTDGGIAELVRAPATRLSRREEPLPRAVDMPAPRVPRDQLPRTWTASAHQRLLDCPYQFYVADVLKLSELDIVPEEIERSHYGERVHRILHAFHHGLPGLPGPWAGPLPAAKRAEAEQLLNDITRAVFAPDVQGRFTTRAWLYHWQAMIPAYLDWLQRHSAEGRKVAASELKVERTIYVDGEPLVLKGRIDRVDEGGQGAVVLDYKTGQLPDMDEILAGEQAQLPFYTLILETTVEAAMYVGLREPPVKTGRELAGSDLTLLRKLLFDRIVTVVGRLSAGAALPAWGDPGTCRRCRYEGLCRKELWTIDRPLPTQHAGGQ